MIALIQRVKRAHVEIGEQVVASIEQGMLALIGIEKTDSEETCERLLTRLLAYRIFADENERMNLGLESISGGLLLVPQFTLVADTSRGLRPGFSSAAAPEHGSVLFKHLCEHSMEMYPYVSHGVFSTDMQVHLINDGPVTFHLQVPSKCN